VLGVFGMLVLADQLAVPAVHTLFDENGQINEPVTAERVSALAHQLVSVASKLR